MRGAVLHAPGAFDRQADPISRDPSCTVATCVCGSDLWPYHGIDQVTRARAIGLEFCGTVEQIGDAVTVIQPCQFAIGGFLGLRQHLSPLPRREWHSSCLQGAGCDGWPGRN